MALPHRPDLRSVLPLCWLAGSMLLVTLLVAHLPQERIGCDFFSFWTAGELLASAQSPYDADHQARVQRGSAGQGGPREGALRLHALLLSALARPCVHGTGPAGISGRQGRLDLPRFRAPAHHRLSPEGRRGGIPRRVPMVVVPAFAFSIFSALMGQTAPLVLFLIAACWALLEGRKDRFAGGVLAWLTIKPQLTAVLLAGILLWAMRRGRWGVVHGFILVLGVLCLSSALAVPSWPVEMLGAIRRQPPPTAYFPSIGATWLSVLKTLNVRGWILWVLYSAAALPILAAVVRSALGRDCPSAICSGSAPRRLLRDAVRPPLRLPDPAGPDARAAGRPMPGEAKDGVIRHVIFDDLANHGNEQYFRRHQHRGERIGIDVLLDPTGINGGLVLLVHEGPWPPRKRTTLPVHRPMTAGSVIRRDVARLPPSVAITAHRDH